MKYDVYADIFYVTEDGFVELEESESVLPEPMVVDGLLGKIPMLDLALVKLEDIYKESIEEYNFFSRTVAFKNLGDAVFMAYRKKASGEGDFLTHIYTNFRFCPSRE